MAMTTEQKVGVFFLVAIIALGVIIELVEDWRPFETQHEYRTYFESAVGIKLGDPVRLAGVEVGKVRNIGIEEGKVRIDFYVADGTYLKEDSIAELRQTNLLGGQFLGLDFGSAASAPLPPGSTVKSRENVNIDQLLSSFDRNQERVLGQIADLVEETRGPLKDAVTQIESIVSKIDTGEGTLGRMVNDPDLYEEVQEAVDTIGKVAARLERGEGTLGRLLTDPTLYEDAEATVSNLRTISDRIIEGKGTVGRLFVEDELYVSASDALANIRDIAEKANEGDGTIAKLLNDGSLYEETNQTMERIGSIAKKIDEGEGTLGGLVNDDSLYKDARTVLKKVEKAADGLGDSGAISALGAAVGTLF